MTTAEKRGFIRVNTDFGVTIEAQCGKPAKRWTATALNVSLDGILLSSATALSDDERLVLQFPAEWGNLRVQAAVVRREGTAYGCAFLDLAPETRAVLDQVIYQQWRRSVREKPLHFR